ncbi:MAG: hypothetical protein JSS04_11280 [Proteobacteria bacterium]|nr:hypothetical protein [Pseudomonadota bacterium]
MTKPVLILASAAAILVPLGAFAQSSGDTVYCHSLANVWRAYNGGMDPAADVAVAITHCNSNPGGAIPVLEKALTGDKIKLPPRS